jgi:hypothetical protein
LFERQDIFPLKISNIKKGWAPSEENYSPLYLNQDSINQLITLKEKKQINHQKI